MTWKPAISTAFLCRWWSSRDNQPIQAIVAHGTQGTDSRAYLARGGDRPDGSDRKVSIHALIRKDGTIYDMLPADLAAHHAGSAVWRHFRPGQINVNQVTLGFELENRQDGHDPYTDPQLYSMGWLINRWRAQLGALPLLRHGDIDPSRRKDPVGLSVADMERWCLLAAQKQAGSDPWAAWGAAFPLPAEQRGFGIPQTWLKHTWLGAATGDEQAIDGAVLRAFANGWILYSLRSNTAQAIKRF